MIHIWSLLFSEYICNELNLNRCKQSIISYGLEVIIGASIKLIIYITIPLISGFLNQFAAAYLSAGLLKICSGGYHCSAYYRCLISTFLIFSLIAVISKYMAGTIPSEPILYFSLFLALIIFILLAPVDVKEKPIISLNRRKLLKTISCLMVIIYILLFYYWKPEQNIALASGFAILFHVFTLTKFGNAFLRWVDKSL
ncbi:putative accessory gene regulator protein [Pelotomaculum schinkii]|uniref:Putative accessory gene regulator protein n=1 Tax=Pelotomaculum schinkii TaxID=78350 RepID=A0A4Y7R998_9FIRM|nr:accessory gene regulator B family protein [Pelotomaculum schinkii]TEB05377.1 putative accessory gene regulator protein [Pelotomaculum schinkii]